MYEFEENQVTLARLKPCPVKVTLYTDRLFEELLSVAKNRPEQVEPITVAVLGGSQYIVNGHLRAKALESAGRDSARACLVPVKEVADIVKLHIELNAHGSINPLKMIDAVQFLEKYHAGQSISKRYIELAKKRLYPKVRNKWDEFLDDVCKRYANVELPLYVIERIVKFGSEKEQLTATTILTDTLSHVRETKFVFPAPPDLEMILQTIAPAHQEKKVTVFEPGESEKGWPRINKKEAEEMVRRSSHDSIVRCECGRSLLLNTKTGQVLRVRDDAKNRCIKLEEADPASPVYAVPSGITEFLHASSEDSLRFLKIRSKKELERFAGTIKDDVPLVIILPR